jgi:hypothetical protein
MMHLRVHPVDEKRIRISGIEPFFAECLQQLPEILEKRDAPAVRKRLFPAPTGNDERANEDWKRLVETDLRHLFVSAGEIVVRDLTGLQPESAGNARLQVTFPVEHVNAWMSALNQARLILGELHGVKERDMDAQDFDPRDPKQTAVLKIHIFGCLLHLFVEHESGDEPESLV